MKRVLVAGATSGIAIACARLWAARGDGLVLAARDPARLDQVASDLRVRGAVSVDTLVMEATDLGAHAQMLDAAGPVDVALIAFGTMPGQTSCEHDALAAARAIDTNATAVIALATAILERMERRGTGTLAVISSVAGDRGRASNYVYGAAKAAVTAFCDGARARLFNTGVHVVTIKPGFVDTAMTRNLPLPRVLVTTPQNAARRIVMGIDRKASVLYVPGWWRWIMLIIRHVPEPIFKRLKF